MPKRRLKRLPQGCWAVLSTWQRKVAPFSLAVKRKRPTMLALRVRSTAFGWATIFAFGFLFAVLTAAAVGAAVTWTDLVCSRAAATTVLAGSFTGAPPIAVIAAAALMRPA